MNRLKVPNGTLLLLLAVMFLGKFTWVLGGVDHPIVHAWTGSWGGLVVVAALSLLVHPLSREAGFPGIWSKDVSNKQRFLVPALLGLALASVEIAIAILQGLPKGIHVGFPYSVPVYLTGGIFLELLYHFIPAVFATWIISTAILKGRNQLQVFWVVALLLALWEPIMQILGMREMGMITSTAFATGLFILIFAANIVPLALLRRYGLLAAIAFRLFDYLAWHIVFPLSPW